MRWRPSEAVNVEQWLAGELPAPRSFCLLWRGTEVWMCRRRLDREWEGAYEDRVGRCESSWEGCIRPKGSRVESRALQLPLTLRELTTNECSRAEK